MIKTSNLKYRLKIFNKLDNINNITHNYSLSILNKIVVLRSI